MKNFLFILVLGFFTKAQAAVELPTVAEVDLNQYLGKWYEIAAIPQSFQKKCFKNTMAEYSFAENNLVKVVNTCTESNGTVSVANGAAKIEDPVTKAKLKVTFVKFINWVFSFGGDYWIIDLDKGYNYAVVGHPDRSYAWILARTPSLDLMTLKGINDRLIKNKYDTCKILTSIQDSGNSERKPLCQLFN